MGRQVPSARSLTKLGPSCQGRVGTQGTQVILQGAPCEAGTDATQTFSFFPVSKVGREVGDWQGFQA